MPRKQFPNLSPGEWEHNNELSSKDSGAKSDQNKVDCVLDLQTDELSLYKVQSHK